MSEAEITPQYVNQPKPGKRNGSIKTTDGNYYSCPPALLGMFHQGQPIKVKLSSREYQGQTYWNIESVLGPVQNGDATIGHQTRASGGRDDPETARRIFITGVSQQALQGLACHVQDPQLINNTIMYVVGAAVEAWDRHVARGSSNPNDGEPPF